MAGVRDDLEFRFRPGAVQRPGAGHRGHDIEPALDDPGRDVPDPVDRVEDPVLLGEEALVGEVPVLDPREGDGEIGLGELVGAGVGPLGADGVALPAGPGDGAAAALVDIIAHQALVIGTHQVAAFDLGDGGQEPLPGVGEDLGCALLVGLKNHGIDVYYIPRDSQSSLDEIYGDDPVKSFTQAIKIEVYLETYNDFEGNEEFFSKFGLEVSKGVKVAMSRRSFDKYVSTVVDRNVPKEGDLIYLPTQLKLMEIKFVEQEKSFFQLGRPGFRSGGVSAVGQAKVGYMFEISLETFRYNGELFDTGYTEIDAIADNYAVSVDYTVNVGGTGDYIIDETVYQGVAANTQTGRANAAIANTATARGWVVNWDKVDRTLQLRNVYGAFAANTNIIGVGSNATWSMESTNTQEDASTEFDDNVRIETEADNILDWSESNPFGTANET